MILFLLKATIFSAVAYVALMLLRKASAATRHAATLAIFPALLLIPFLAGVSPQRRIELPIADQSPILLHFHPVSSGPVASHLVSAIADPVPILQAVWLMVAAGLILRYMWTFARLARIVRRGETLDCGAIRCDVPVPCTAWFGRSVILVPRSFTEWPNDVQQSALVHERAHVRRRDWPAQAIMHLTCCLIWPNIFAWLLSRQARLLAEHAADDVVLAEGIAPANYAQTLIAVLRSCPSDRFSPAIPMAARPDLSRRIQMILNKNRRRGGISVAAILLAAGGITALVLPVASLAVVGQKLDNAEIVESRPPIKYADLSPETQKTIREAEANRFYFTDHSENASSRPVEIRTADGELLFSLQKGAKKPKKELFEVPVHAGSSNHAKWVASGTKCTDCHRSVGSHQYQGGGFQKKYEKTVVELCTWQFRSKSQLFFAPSKGQPPINKDGAAFAIPAKTAEYLVDSLPKGDAVLLNAPRMRVFSGQKVTIQMSGDSKEMKPGETLQRLISATPTLFSEDLMELKFALVDLIVQPSEKTPNKGYSLSMEATGEIMLQGRSAMAITEKRNGQFYLTIILPVIVKE